MGMQQYWKCPHGVMNDVRCLLSLSSSTWWRLMQHGTGPRQVRGIFARPEIQRHQGETRNTNLCLHVSHGSHFVRHPAHLWHHSHLQYRLVQGSGRPDGNTAHHFICWQWPGSPAHLPEVTPLHSYSSTQGTTPCLCHASGHSNSAQLGHEVGCVLGEMCWLARGSNHGPHQRWHQLLPLHFPAQPLLHHAVLPQRRNRSLVGCLYP